MSIRVLLVEDTPVAQIVAKNHLTKQGCEVDIASSGDEALEKILQIQYDIILMDIGLGDGPDGFEVTTQIKSENTLNQLTPIIAITSHEEESFEDKAFAVGMTDFYKKPFTEAIAKTIVDALKTT